MRKQFKVTVSDLAARDDRVVVILGDISHFLFRDFQEKFPDRFYNMGICENTIISVSAGLSACGLHPFAHTINPFITERSLEQIKLDFGYNRFGGNIVSTGASFDYAWDGATHHCYTDLAILRLIPGMEVMQPGTPKELDTLMRSQYSNGKPSYFRMSDNPHGLDLPVEFGRGVIVQDKKAYLTVVTAGPILANVHEACKDLPVNILYFATIKPMDHELIARFGSTEFLVVQDAFGLQEAVAEVPGLRITCHGLPDEFCVWYGTVHDIRKRIGLDAAGIREAVRKRLAVVG